MATTLEETAQRAWDNGHTIVDVPNTEPVAPGVFARCTQCDAHLRFYMGRGMGEAYSTNCRMVSQEPAPPTPEEARSILAEKYAGTTLNGWRDIIHQYAVDKGWYDEGIDRSLGTLLMLVTSELSEAYEEFRHGKEPNETYYNEDSEHPTKPEGIPSELVDAIIRLLDMCGLYGIDVDAMVAEKHEYNLTRPYRHGGKRT